MSIEFGGDAPVDARASARSWEANSPKCPSTSTMKAIRRDCDWRTCGLVACASWTRSNWRPSSGSRKGGLPTCSIRLPTVGEATNETCRDRGAGPHRGRHLRWQPARAASRRPRGQGRGGDRAAQWRRPGRIEDVVFAQSYANSEAPCIGRWVALHANLPVSVPGLQIDRRCGGGLQAVITAAMTVQTGAADVVIAGGVESMSNIEHYTTTARWGASRAIRRCTTGSTAVVRDRSPHGVSVRSAA